MMRRIAVFACALLLAALAACGKPSGSDAAVSRKAGQPAWDAAANPFVVAGWTSGDRASWQEQMNKRAQTQNEFLRVN